MLFVRGNLGDPCVGIFTAEGAGLSSEPKILMSRRIRVEVKARNDFWRNAISVEWDYQFPERKLEEDENKFFLIEEEWYEDFRRVAEQCLSKTTVAPDDPSRRQLFRRLLPRLEKD